MSDKLNIKIKLAKQMRIATRPLTEAISKDLKVVIGERFRTSTASDGSQWAGITHRTGQPLWVTGKLARSFKRSYNKDRAEIGTNDIRARIHNYGGVIKAKNKPYLHFKVGDNWVKVKQVKIKARPFIGFNQHMVSKYTQMISEYYKKEINKKIGGAE